MAKKRTFKTKRKSFNTNINNWYKLSEKQRRSALLHALEGANAGFKKEFDKTIKKREKYKYHFKQEGSLVNETLIAGFMSARFRGKMGVEYKLMKMAERGATAKQMLSYVQKSLGLKNVTTTIDNKDKLLQLAGLGIIYIGQHGGFNNMGASGNYRVWYFKDLTQHGKTIVIPDSQFQRMSIDDILIEFGRLSGKRKIETDEEIPIIYKGQKVWGK